jgi:hypothetical protein
MKKIDLNRIINKIKSILVKEKDTNLSQKKSLKLSQKQKINFFDSLYNLINS